VGRVVPSGQPSSTQSSESWLAPPYEQVVGLRNWR